MGLDDHLFSLAEASALHRAAVEVERLSNAPQPVGMTEDTHAQRKAILSIAAKIVFNERDKHLAILKDELNNRSL